MSRLIQKIYEVDPLICPKCQGPMKIIAFIEDEEVIKKDFETPGFMESKNKDAAQDKKQVLITKIT